MTSTVLLKRGKSYGIAVYVPKETILKEMAAKFDLVRELSNIYIYYIINKLSAACYAIRNIKYTVTIETLRLIYFAHVHSIISYGIMFWGSASLAQKVFVMQKKNYQSHNEYEAERLL
jgi:hypothetical protein